MSNFGIKKMKIPVENLIKYKKLLVKLVLI